jgi:methylmalonyl-CoA mutase
MTHDRKDEKLTGSLAREAWKKAAESELKRSPEPHVSRGGATYQPIYFPGDVEPDASLPGKAPFTRGVRASMYQGRPWTLRQYAGFSTAEDSNQFFKTCLSRGQRGLSVAFDLPTHRGYDSDHERAQGDVGKAGVAIDTVEDMALLFADIPLSEVSVSMTMNGAVLPIMAAYLVTAEEQGAKPEQLRGTIQNDILKEFLVRNTYIYPPGPSLRITRDVIAYASRHLPLFNPVSVSGYHMKEAGAPEELELGLTLADALAYVESALAAGLDVDDFAPRISFFFGIGMDLFLEVAKLRAARKLWAEVMRERYSPKNPDSLKLRMHCQTSGVSLTAQEPMNNIVRTTVEALAAVLGGTQSLHTNAFDEALGLPTNESARVARATQLIIQEETDVTRVVDPLAGCYLVEDLTEQLVNSARKILEEIESRGGMTAAIESGFVHARIAAAAAARQAGLDKGSERIVGVNCYKSESQAKIDVRIVDHETVLGAQLERLERVRRARDESLVERLLGQLEKDAASEDANLLASAVACMKARATVGEVSYALEKVFGRFQPRATTLTGIYSAQMEDETEWQALQAEVAAFAEKHGRRPRILVAKVGQDGHDRGAKVVASGFADAGFDVDVGPLFQTPREVARAAVESDVHVVGISTQAGGHQVLVPEMIRELEKQGAGHVLVVCGGIIPPADRAALFQNGVSHIFEPGTRVLEAASAVLAALHQKAP